MRMLALALSLCFITPANAFEPKPWQKKAVTIVESFGKVKKAEWSQSLSLWIFVKRDNTNWQAAGNMLCKSLAGAGKPDGELAIITILDHQAAQYGQFKQVSKVPCY